jgi:hypothetical protein
MMLKHILGIKYRFHKSWIFRYVGFWGLAALNTKITIFWDATQCNFVDRYCGA